MENELFKKANQIRNRILASAMEDTTELHKQFNELMNQIQSGGQINEFVQYVNKEHGGRGYMKIIAIK